MYLFCFGVIIRFVIQRLGGSHIPILIRARMWVCGIVRSSSSSSSICAACVGGGGRGSPRRNDGTRISRIGTNTSNNGGGNHDDTRGCTGIFPIVQTGTLIQHRRRHHYGVAAVAAAHSINSGRPN